MSLMVFNCYFIGWLCVFIDVSQMLTEVGLSHPRCPKPLTWLNPHHLMFSTVSYWYHFIKSEVSLWQLLDCCSIISGVSLLLTRVVLHNLRCVSLLLPVVVLCHFRFSSLSYLAGSVSSEVSQYCLQNELCVFLTLSWVRIVSGVSWPLTKVLLSHCKCLTSTHCSGFAMSQVFHWCSCGNSASS